MSPPRKPEGYSTVSPYLLVPDAGATIDFCRAVFDAEELRRFTKPDGWVQHAEIRIGDTVVMMGEATDGWPAVGAHVHVYVDDVDATYRRALEAGGVPVQEPTRKDDPDRRGGVKDAGGTTWWIATPVG